MRRLRILLLLTAGGLLCGQNVLAAEAGLGVQGVVLVAHHIQSGWQNPRIVTMEMALGPAHIGGFYIGGIGLHQVQGFGNVTGLLSYVGQGSVEHFRWIKGFVVNFSVANEGLFQGKPAYFFAVGISLGGT